MDLTAELVSTDMGAAPLSPLELGDGTKWGPLLRAGSAIAAEARSAVKVGLRQTLQSSFPGGHTAKLFSR